MGGDPSIMPGGSGAGGGLNNGKETNTDLFISDEEAKRWDELRDKFRKDADFGYKKIGKAIQKLDKEEQDFVEAYYEDEHSFSEIAEDAGVHKSDIFDLHNIVAHRVAAHLGAEKENAITYLRDYHNLKRFFKAIPVSGLSLDAQKYGPQHADH